MAKGRTGEDGVGGERELLEPLADLQCANDYRLFRTRRYWVLCFWGNFKDCTLTLPSPPSFAGSHCPRPPHGYCFRFPFCCSVFCVSSNVGFLRKKKQQQQQQNKTNKNRFTS
jgi:hypothetical protein